MDLSKLSTDDLRRLIAQLHTEESKGKQQDAYRRSLGEEQAAMMDERGFWDNAAAGVGNAIVNAGRGVSQWLPGGVTREQVDEAKRLDAPLMESGGGITGNLAGNIALALAPGGAAKVASLSPRAAGLLARIPDQGTVVGGAALGAGMGAIQPVGTGDSRGANVALGGLLGGAIPAVVSTGKGLKAAAWDSWTEGGRDSLSLRLLFKDKSPAEIADIARRLQNAREVVPGSAPTAAQATLDPTIATVERALMGEIGPAQSGLVARQEAQKAARDAAMRQAAGTADDVAQIGSARGQAFRAGTEAIKGAGVDVPTARTVSLIDKILASGNAESKQLRTTLTEVRGQFFEAYPAQERLSAAAKGVQEAVASSGMARMPKADYDALLTARRVLLGAARKGSDDVDTALAQVSALPVKTKTAGKVLDDAIELLKADNSAYKADPERLVGLYRELNQRRAKLKADGADMPTLKALDAVKRSLGNAIDRATKDALPAGSRRFRDVQRDYASASQQMDAMRIVQNIENRAMGKPTAGLTAAGEPFEGARPILPNMFMRMTDPANQASVVRAATGKARPGDFGRELTPEQNRILQMLRGDVMRADTAAGLGAPRGSPTAQNLITANFIEQAMGGSGLPNAFGPSALKFLTETPFVGAGIKAATRSTDQALKEHLARLMLDPQRLGQIAAARAAAQQGTMGRLAPAAGQLLPPSLSGLGLGMFGRPRIEQENGPYPPRR